MTISILSRVVDFRKLADDSNAGRELYKVRRHERYAGTYVIYFPELEKNLLHRKVWNNADADVAFFESLPEALSIINEQNRIIFELADKLAQYENEKPKEQTNDKE